MLYLSLLTNFIIIPPTVQNLLFYFRLFFKKSCIFALPVVYFSKTQGRIVSCFGAIEEVVVIKR